MEETETLSNYDKKKKIYLGYFNKINDINFTMREIDIISCIVNNRGDKKIATILAISPNTVSTHIGNIMSKLQCNSREMVIDFIEKSGKLEILKEYYRYLVIDSIFAQQLIKIGKLFNKNNLLLELITKEEVNLKEFPLLQQLQKDLKLANINLSIVLNMNSSIKNNLHMDLFIEQSSKKIRLIFDKAQTVKTIDFREEDNYYFLVLELIGNIIDKPDFDKIVQEFKDEYSKYSSETLDKVVKTLSSIKPEPVKKDKLIIPYYILFIIGIFIVIGFIYFTQYNAKDQIRHNSPDTDIMIQQQVENILKEFSANSTNKNSLRKNHGLIKNVEYTVEQILKKMKNSNNFTFILPAKLIPYLCIIHSLATYEIYTELNISKGKELLEYSKKIIEEYVNKRSKIILNFDNMTYEEVYTELSIIDGLPEMYTRVIYLLARVILYEKDNTTQAIKYFEMSKYLGNKLGLFEGYLSDRSGLGIIKANQILNKANRESNKDIEKKLNEVIELYENLKNDDKAYKLNYQSPEITSKMIVPKEDRFNQLVCARIIISYYSLLLTLSNEESSKKKYLEKISAQLANSVESEGLLQLINDVPDKEIAKTYNSLGKVLLNIYDSNLKFDILKTIFVNQIKLNTKDDLEIIKQIFEIAKDKGRALEFSKVESYNGLIEVYKRQLKENINPEMNEKLTIGIKELTNKRNEVNKLLKDNNKINFE